MEERLPFAALSPPLSGRAGSCPLRKENSCMKNSPSQNPFGECADGSLKVSMHKKQAVMQGKRLREEDKRTLLRDKRP